MNGRLSCFQSGKKLIIVVKTFRSLKFMAFPYVIIHSLNKMEVHTKYT